MQRSTQQVSNARHRRVVNNSELISQSANNVSNNSELKSRFTSYLCFSVYVTYNDLTHPYNDHYSDSQKKTHDLIQDLHNEGLGYRKISKILNDRGMTTHTGKVWTNSHVYSVLKRYRERVSHIENTRQKPSDVTYSKFEMTFVRELT